MSTMAGALDNFDPPAARKARAVRICIPQIVRLRAFEGLVVCCAIAKSELTDMVCSPFAVQNRNDGASVNWLKLLIARQLEGDGPLTFRQPAGTVLLLRSKSGSDSEELN